MTGPRPVVIVGAGADAWLTAACLDALLNSPGVCAAEITVLEPPGGATSKRAEATLPEFRDLPAILGLDEATFLGRAAGTYRQATRHAGWLHGGEEAWWHPFARHRGRPLDDSAARWLASDRSVPFAATVSAQPALCEKMLAPAAPGTGAPGRYGYHLDTGRLAAALCDHAVERGARRIEQAVTDVERRPDGTVAALATGDGGRVAGDLFVDCTGTAASLVGTGPGADWIDTSRYLPNDRLATLTVPYTAHYPGFVRPYTLNTAQAAGWIAELPLQTHREWQFAHSCHHIDDTAVARVLEAVAGEGAAGGEIRIEPITTGYRASAWVGNCVAVGRAQAAVEPLAAGPLSFTLYASRMLAEHFPYRGAMDALAFRYNRLVAARYHEVLDFTNLYYALTQRSDSDYWRDARRAERLREKNRARLGFWRSRPPAGPDFEDGVYPGEALEALPATGIAGDRRAPAATGELFGLSSVEALLYGMDFLREECDRWYGRDRPPATVPDAIGKRIGLAAARLPAHDEYLRRHSGMPDYRPA